MNNVAKEMEHLHNNQTRLVGPPDARKRACPVRGALDGNLLLQGSKALSFDPIRRSGHWPQLTVGIRLQDKRGHC